MNGILTVITYLITAVIGAGLFTLPMGIKTYSGIYVFLLIAAVFMYIGSVFSTIDYIELLEQYSTRLTFFILMWTMWIASWASNAILIKGIVNTSALINLPINVLKYETLICFILIIGVFILNYFSSKNTFIRNILAGIKFFSIFLFIYGAITLPYKGTLSQGTLMYSHFANSVWCFVGLENTYIILKNLKADKDSIRYGLMVGLLLLTLIYLISIIVTNKTVINAGGNCFLVLSKKLFGTHLIGLLLPLLINLLSLYAWLSDGATFAEEMATENIFPSVFGDKNVYDVPYFGLLFISVFTLIIMLLLNNSQSNLSSIIDSFASIFLLFYAYVMGVYAYDQKSIISGIISAFFLYLLYMSGSLTANVLLLISGLPIYLLKEYQYI